MAFDYALPSRSWRLPWSLAWPADCWVALMCCVALAAHVSVPLNCDTSWFLTVAERMLAGQRLYVDIVEVNPPMSPWLYVPFAWIARLVGVSSELVTIFATIAFGLATIWAANRTIVRAELVSSGALWRLVAAFALIVSPITTFAQREHFAILAALPLLACLASRARDRAPGWAEVLVAGALGGFAVAIKPPLALGFLAPALYVAWRARSFRPILSPELVIAGALSLLYVAAALTFAPAYFNDMLPLARAIYLPNRISLIELVLLPTPILLAALMATLWLMRPANEARPLRSVFTAAVAGFTIVYFLQGHGWPYHLLPALGLAMIAFLLAVVEKPQSSTPGGRRTDVLFFVTALAILPVAEFIRWSQLDADLYRTVSQYGSGRSVVLLGGDISYATPLHRMAGDTLVNRGTGLWITMFAIERCADEQDEAILKSCADAIKRDRVALREDMARTTPDIVIVEATPFNWLPFVRRDAETARMLDGYRELAPVRHGNETLKVLVREGLAETGEWSLRR